MRLSSSAVDEVTLKGVIQKYTGQRNIRTDSFDNQVELVGVTVQKLCMGILSFLSDRVRIARSAHYSCSIVCLRN